MTIAFLPLSITEILHQPWHWAFSGFILAFILLLSTWVGKSLGVSSSFKVYCAVAGAGKRLPFFNMKLKDEYWRLAFVGGTVLGGYIASHFMQSDAPLAISEATIAHLANDFNMSYPTTLSEGDGYIPTELFNITNIKGVILLIMGGLLVGFGARYAGGCSSGHAITGLSHLQLPSLVTVVGFFIGGIIMTWGILPLILG